METGSLSAVRLIFVASYFLLPVETFGKFTTFKTNIVISQFNKTSVYSFGQGGSLLVIKVLQVAQTLISQMQRSQKWQ